MIMKAESLPIFSCLSDLSNVINIMGQNGLLRNIQTVHFPLNYIVKKQEK